MAKVAVQRAFEVSIGLDVAWQRFSVVERWPEWAPHIKSVKVTPPGPLGPSSRGALQIRGFGRNKFRISKWEPMSRWEWTGGLPVVRITYDHQFVALSNNSTQLIWVVSLDGPFASLVRPIFSRIYGRNVDIAIPRLKVWILE